MSLESRQCSHQIHENFKLSWQWKGISTLAWMMSSSLAAARWNPRHASVIRAGYCQIFLPCWVGFATAFWRSVCFWWLLIGKPVSFDVPSEAANPRPSSGQNMQVPRSSWRRWTPTQKRRGRKGNSPGPGWWERKHLNFCIPPCHSGFKVDLERTQSVQLHALGFS